jgi:PAS domain S-box-containing protein
MAEEAFQRKPRWSPQVHGNLSSEDLIRMFHELSVHQIELEMQNEELRRAEAELEASLARYSDLYESAPVGYFSLVDGVISEANLAAANLLGIARNALIGMPITRFISGEDQDIYCLCRDRFAEAEATQECELRMVRKDGTVFWAHVLTRGRRAPPPSAGSVAGHASVQHLVLSDITARRRGEEDKARLERLLQQAEKSKAIGTLACGIAHDFNNLLATIVGNANLTLMTIEPDSKVATYMAAIEKAAMRAAKLTHQMLAYAGQGKRASAELDLNLVLRESLHFIQDAIPAQVDLHAVLSDRLPFVLADPTQISESVVNLLTNALEAMPNGPGRRLIVRTRAECLDQGAIDGRSWVLPVAPGHFATLEVTDEGAGMPPEVVTRLFEPFFSTKFMGRGLGLAEVIGVVRDHGGGIQVQTEVGKGSSFKILLPAMRTPRTIHPGASMPSWRGQGSILVVEHDEEERKKVRRMAEDLGFTVLEATEGMEAVEVFCDHHGDLALVLLDLSLPKMDGRVAFRAIHEIDSSIPVVLGHPHGVEEKGIPEEAQAGVLGRPYRLAEFRGVLQRTLA